MSIVVNALLTGALAEIRSARAGDVVNPDDMDLALLVFNELLDSLNAEGRAIYNRALASFTLTPALQPHTIGLAANAPTFSVAVGAPLRIQAANIVLSGASAIRVPLSIIDDSEWNNIRARLVTASIPTSLFYDTTWPNGSIYLWPVPTTAYGLELQTDTLLAQVALGDTLDLPFGYQQALRLTLAELLASSFGQTLAQATVLKAREARARVWANNDVIPTLCTRDAGMPGGRSGGWNYLTGMVD